MLKFGKFMQPSQTGTFGQSADRKIFTEKRISNSESTDSTRRVFKRRVRRLQFPQAAMTFSACQVVRLNTSKFSSNHVKFNNQARRSNTFLTSQQKPHICN